MCKPLTYFSGLATICFCLGISVAKANEPPPLRALNLDWTGNIGSIALDVEMELHTDYVLTDLNRGSITMRDNRLLLKRILQTASEKISVQPRYTKEEALQICRIIHEILAEEGFTYRDYSNEAAFVLGANVFGYGLAKKQIDCVSYCLLGLAVAEHLNLPMVAIYMPGHFALRWLLSQNDHINLELSIPAGCEDDFYMDWKNIPEQAREKGVYLRNLSRQEVIAQHYYNIALVWAGRGELARALRATHRSIALFPDFPDAYNLQGIIWNKKGETEQALENFDKAIALDPEYSEAWINRTTLITKHHTN